MNKIIFITFLTISLFADNYKEAMQAFYQRDFNLTLELLRPLIKNEDPRAQYQLGVMYRYGKGIKEDYQASRKLFKKAFITNQKLACESYFLGMCQGEGDAEAQNGLGEAHWRHHWAEQDRKKAAYWFKESASQGNANAQYRLGNMYYRDRKGFFEKLADKFIPNLHQTAPSGYSYSGSTESGIPQDKDKALFLFEKSAEQGHPGGQYMLAEIYSSGTVVKKDTKKAYKLYSKAANQNFSPAQDRLANLYLQGIGTPLNFKKAAYWFERALENKQYVWRGKSIAKRIKAKAVPIQDLANEGNAKAQYEMGQIYHKRIFYGYDIPRDLKKAFYWYEQAIKNDYAPAKIIVGNVYCYGRESEIWAKQDTEKALYWYNQAAEQAYPEAFYQLYKVYSGGCNQYNKDSSFKPDKEKSEYWLNKANEAGYQK